MADAALALRDTGAPSTSGRVPDRVFVPRHQLPLNLLVATHDSAKHPKETLAKSSDIIRWQKGIDWANKREHFFAVAAAGFHVAMFCFNLAFWGFEGTPPDRYWPDQPRWRLGIRPGQYGNLRGASKLYYYYMNKLAGGKD